MQVLGISANLFRRPVHTQKGCEQTATRNGRKDLNKKKDAKPENTFRKRIQFPHPTEPLIRLELMTYALRMRCSTN